MVMENLSTLQTAVQDDLRPCVEPEFAQSSCAAGYTGYGETGHSDDDDGSDDTSSPYGGWNSGSTASSDELLYLSSLNYPLFPDM